MNGWIKIYREITDHWIWKDPVKFQWWIDILLNVNHEDAKVNLGYELYECKRGQTIRSLQKWAERWNCNKDSARNFLRLLEKDGMILHESLSKTTRITVCNYDIYQHDLHEKKLKITRQPNDGQTVSDPNKKDKELKEKNNKPILFIDSPISDFSVFVKELSGYSKGKYKDADMNFYFEAVKNWSESRNKRMINWTATSAGFMIRDIHDNKFKRK